MKHSINRHIILFLAILLFSNNIKAQDNKPIQHLYSIAVMQAFESWGDCNTHTKPDFENANIKFQFGNTSFNKVFTSDSLDQLLFIRKDFINHNPNKNLRHMTNASDDSLTGIIVDTEASDIRIDKKLHYEFDLNNNKFGEIEEPHQASDPCSFLNKNKREGYTMTTTVIVDDPIFITYNGDGTYNLDREIFTIQVDDYYENRMGNRPILEVAPAFTDDWEPVANNNIIIKPGEILDLSYKDIVGEKSNKNPKYYDWMGKKLQFRIVKTLINGKKTFGNIEEVIFYPEGPQFNIHKTDRNFCNTIAVYIEFTTSDDKNYLSEGLFFWKAQIYPLSYNCKMDPTDKYDTFHGANIYKITFIDNNTGAEKDPFDAEGNPVECTIQFETIVYPSYTSEKTFVIPPKLKPIAVSQKHPDGTAYDIPDISDVYVMLKIDDPDFLSTSRLPYKIVEGSDTLKTITNLPDTTGLGAEFEEEYIKLMKGGNNPYLNYFSYQYKQWFNTHSTTINHPNEQNQFYVYKYHKHEHEHNCAHTHVHTHSCMDIIEPGKPIGCESSHEISSGSFCSTNHSHVIGSRPFYNTHSHSHTHYIKHSHEHEHTGDHAHGGNTNYDYTEIRRNPLPNGSSSTFSSAYTYVSSIKLTTTDFNAEYEIVSNGTTIKIPIWDKNDIMTNIYPDKGIAKPWYDEFKAIFKEKWMFQKVGVKVSKNIHYNTDQYLKLVDGDGCEYPEFKIHVKAPPIPDFDSIIVSPPTDACAKNGTAKIIYKGGGSPPYVHWEGGTLSSAVNKREITVGGLQYGDNYVSLSYGSTESIKVKVTIGSATIGITSTSAFPQTCTPANGSITINLGSVVGTKTYRLIDKDNPNLKYEKTSSSNSITIPNLPAGLYNLEVESGSCVPFTKEGIEVADQTFKITNLIPRTAKEIGDTGGVSMSFINRTNNVTWISGVPTVFNTYENTNNINYTGITPGTYNYTARHIDNQGRTCNISDTIKVTQPSFEAEINIYENSDSSIVSVNLKKGNALILPYRFRLLDSLGTVIETGSDNRSFSSIVKINGSYKINLMYGSGNNNINIDTFSYPSTPIKDGHSITVPIKCPGGTGTLTLNPEGGLDGTGFTISTDGSSFNSTTSHTVKGGNFSYYIKDADTRSFDVSGNAITLNRSLVNSFTVLIPEPNKVSAHVMTVDVTCAGANNGKVSLTNLSGGSGTYQYRVDNNSWISPLMETSGINPGKHKVYLKDSANNCPEITLTNISISQPDSLKIDSVSIIQPTCELENGEIFVKAMGGNGLFQFDWNHNGNSFYSNNIPEEDSITALDSLQHGLYSLKITDNNDCELNYNVQLNEYFNPEITDVSIFDVRCYNEANGEVKVDTLTGTTALKQIMIDGVNLTYKDTVYELANSFLGLRKGIYELKAIDDSACISEPYPLTVNQPDTILYALVDTIIPVLHKGSATGQIHSKVYGGNTGLKEIILFDSALTNVDQQLVRNKFPANFDNLYAGNYSLQVTDLKGCTYHSPVQTVSEPLTSLGFTVIQKKDAMCKAQTGSFTIEGFGGWGDYSYKRASDNGFYNLTSFKNLYAGSYIVSVQDKLGAVFTDTLVIYEPKDSLQTRLIDYSDPTCGNNGSISLNLNGGIAPYQLVFDKSSDTTKIVAPQDYTISNRPVGEYLLHVTDGNGCKFELETSLSDQKLLAINNFKLSYPTANGATDGSIEAFVNGGKAPLSFAWKEQFGSALAETSSMLTNVASGHYELTVSEQDGCSLMESVYLPNISDLALEIVELQHETSYLAKNGYSKLFSNLDSLVDVEIIYPQGAKTFYTVSDSTANFYQKNNNLYLQNLTGGSYFIMVSNNVGEKAYAEFEIEPYRQFYFDAIHISPVKEINDSSGIVHVVVAGGAGGNRFDWEYLDGTMNHLDSTNNEFTSILNHAIAGNYRITVTDKYNNSISQTLTIEQPAAPLEITISEYRNESCKDDEDAYVILQATGGWGDYQFKQDVVKYYSNDDTWLNLDVREHYFYLTDKMGAMDSIAINITEPDYLKTNDAFIDSVDCKNANDGSITFDIQGGTAPYRFLVQETGATWEQGSVANNLAEGTYTIIFTDINNCVGQDTISKYMPEPDSLIFSTIDVTHTTCNTNNGSISVTMQGGTLPYTYSWTDLGNNTIGTGNTVSGLKQNARYVVNVIDAHECPQQHKQLINPSTNPIIVDVDTTPVLCYGGFTGTANIVEVTSAEPFAPYSFSWSNADIGEFADGFKAGIDSVTITDTNNCSTVKFFEITQPDTLRSVVTDFKDAHCFGYNDGFIEILASGGVGNYQFTWSNGETIERIESLYKGIYSVTITDANLCSIQKSFEIMEPDKLIVDLGEDLRICPGNSISIDGQDFSTHQWSNSNGVFSNERFITVNREDEYSLEVTNSIGCFANDAISLSIGNDALQADFLMTSEANLGDTVFIYEISNIELDSLYWDYNPDAFISIADPKLPNYMLQIISSQTGIYNVGLWAYTGGCISLLVKQLEIVEYNDSIGDNDLLGYTDPLISELTIYPNPTDGNFIVKVVLREIADIELNMFSINQGVIVDQRKGYQQDYYEIDYRLNGLNTGVYVIMVTAQNERKQIKIIIE